MNKLIIITGISGTGKSTLAKKLYNKIENSTLLSFDILTENIYDIVGFKNKTEKKSLKQLNTNIYKSLIEECMKRKDEIIILEKPFKIEWKDYLDQISKKYKYKILTINLFTNDFNKLFDNLLKREMSKAERHPSHYLTSYSLKEKELYEPYFEYEYNTLKQEYDSLESNSINLGKVININDITKLNLSNLIQTISQ